jgi:gamma-D-glutamyl-L-lysine dipeptidyl-peptidase
MRNVVCLLSAVPVRSGPSHEEEMVTQMVFGEHAAILDKQQKWSLVEISADSYQGWVYNSSVYEIPDDLAEAMAASRPEVSGSIVLMVMNNKDRQPFYISAGSLLYDYDPGTGSFRTGGQEYTCLQTPAFHKGKSVRENIATVAREFMNVPYLWGGKTPFGMDCSGFTQIVFRVFGINLPRNSRQQVDLGKPVTRVTEALAGDLAFFQNEQGRIIHTGLVTGNGQILHASGMVRIDRLDQTGIYNNLSGSYTHRLKIIKNISDT